MNPINMDHIGPTISNVPEMLAKFEHVFILMNVILILVFTSLLAILKILITILEPSNYELDMTSEKFCKPLMELNNSLRYKSSHKNSLIQEDSLNSYKHYNTALLQKSLDCATDLLNSETQLVTTDTDFDDGANLTTQAGSANHVYPNGWIPVMESWKVASGTVEKAVILGQDIVVTRSSDGTQVSVLEAYCPHMGVHLGIGGQVREIEQQSCIECPFHGWTFRASDGQCIRIPYQKVKNCTNIPKQAKLKTWDCVEVDNFIYIWHHVDCEPPSWHLNPSEQISAGTWQLAGRSCHKTNLELRDMHENGADMNHFEGIHNDLFLFGGHITEIRPFNYIQKYVRHHWLPEWKPILNEMGKMTHMARMKLQSWISLFNLRLFDITVRAYQIGPARVNLYYDSKWYGRGMLIMNTIPLGGRRTKYVQHIYTERTLFQFFMAKWVLYGEIKMLERDFFIWNHKKNIKNPIFIPEDKTLKQFRLWYKQFYKRKRKIIIQDNGDIDKNANVITKNLFNKLDF